MANLRKISKEELNKIIKNHQHYLNKDCDGWEKMKADLSYMDLSYMNLSYTNLSYADLSYANLSHTDLLYADLSYADLTHTYLDHADLTYADLSYASLFYTYLFHANLFNTNLTDVCYDETTTFFQLQCPEKGSFIGYKKSGDKIAELRIEEDSKRSSATTRKCRASKVTVLSITSLDGKEEFTMCENTGRYEFTYEIGKTYEIEDFDENRWHECGKGIHFFLTRQEAVKY